MVKLKKIKKIIIVFLLVLVSGLSACQLNFLGQNDSTENSGTDDPNKNVVELIVQEHNQLVKLQKTDKTTFTFKGVVIDMSLTYYDDLDENYEVTMILDASGVNIGILLGQVKGTNPRNITGLEEGTEVTVIGQIDHYSTLICGSAYASICFTKPEILWNNMNDNDNSNDVENNGDVDNGNGDVDNDNGDVDNDNGDVGNNDSDVIQYNSVNFAMINDTHGAFADSNDGTAIGRVDTLLDDLEDKNGDYIKIANGDILQGSYVSSKTYGYALIESLNVMDFDVFVIGNHEFDWGLDKIAKYKDGDLSNGEADFPFLGANIYYKGTKKRPEWIDPYEIINYGNLKVGIIGLIGGTYESSILTSHVKDYEFLDDPTQLVSDYAKKLRTEKDCDVVVIATHDYDDAQNSKFANLSGDSRVDAIFCAHTHQRITESLTRKDGVKIPVVQNYDKNDTVQEVVIKLDDSKNMNGYSTQLYYMKDFSDNPRYEISSDLDSVYKKYNQLIVESNSVIGKTSSYLSDDALGDLAAKGMFYYNYNNPDYSKIDLAVLNTGGVRSTIDSGEITMAEVFNTFPFENRIYLIKAPGSLLKKLMSSSYYYTYSTSSSFNSSTIYTVAVIDYVYESVYNTSLFSSVVSEVYSEYLMRDVFIEYLKEVYN